MDGSSTWDCVVKFAWPSDKRQREKRLLKLSKERGVTGVAEWIHHEEVSINESPDTIASLRRDMRFDSPRKLSIKSSWVDSGIESSRTSGTKSLTARSRSSRGRELGLGINTGSTTLSSSEKRKREDDPIDRVVNTKRSRPGGNRPDVASVHVTEQVADTAGIHSVVEVTDADSLAAHRVRRLAIAYTVVWLSHQPVGHSTHTARSESS